MNLAQFLRDGHARYPDKTALIFGGDSWTHDEVDSLTERLATNLLAAGLLPGDRVALHMQLSGTGLRHLWLLQGRRHCCANQ